MPALERTKAAQLVKRRHKEWTDHQVSLAWLLDSLEGGQAYRNAEYGKDLRGEPLRNLLRHKREYPLPTEDGRLAGLDARGKDMSLLSGVDDYENRRARTPVPCLVGHAIETHLGRVYSREVSRGYGDPEAPDAEDGTVDPDGPAAALAEFWGAVDGTGTCDIDRWMREEVAPVLLACGQVDLLFDRPRAPADRPIASEADVDAVGLKRAIGCVLLPENVVWWRLDPVTRNYQEVLIQERHETDDGGEVVRFRHWTAVDSTLYDADGGVVEASLPHRYGRPPIIRVLYRRHLKCRNIGMSAYYELAEIQRSVYNTWSELILGDVLQAFPILQGPESVIGAETTVGPGWCLTMHASADETSWQGAEYVDPPKGSADSTRSNLQIALDRADRAAGLTKPAGATTGGTVAQSGASKWFDAKEGNAKLGEVADKLAACERAIAEMALTVRLGRPITRDEVKSIRIGYSKEFELWTATDLADLILDLQKIFTGAGTLPAVESIMIKQYVREVMKGLSDGEYARLDIAIDEWLESKAQQKAQANESFGSTHGNPDANRGKIGDEGDAGDAEASTDPEDAADEADPGTDPGTQE